MKCDLLTLVCQAATLCYGGDAGLVGETQPPYVSTSDVNADADDQVQ